MISGVFMYLIFIILGVSSGAFKKVPNQRKTNGTITALKQNNKVRKNMATNTAIVSYEVEGKEYIVKTRYQSSFFKREKILVVKYNFDNPENSFVRCNILIYLFLVVIFIYGTVLIGGDIIKF